MRHSHCNPTSASHSNSSIPSSDSESGLSSSPYSLSYQPSPPPMPQISVKRLFQLWLFLFLVFFAVAMSTVLCYHYFFAPSRSFTRYSNDDNFQSFYIRKETDDIKVAGPGSDILYGLFNATLQQFPACQIPIPAFTPHFEFEEAHCYNDIHSRLEDGLLKMDGCPSYWREYMKQGKAFLYDFPSGENETMPIDVEYISAFCSYSNENVLVQNVQKDDVYSRAIEAVKKLQTSAIPKREHVIPININYLLIDSLSRPHFNRGLPKTKELLEDIYTGKALLQGSTETRPPYKIFQFFRYGIVGNNSAPNITPLVSGLSRDELSEKHAEELYNSDNPTFIWDYAKENGYVTTWIDEQCPNPFSVADWQLPQELFDPNDQWGGKSALYRVDHIASDVFCHHEYAMWNQYSRRTRCIGARPAHMLILDYLKSFYSHYEDVGKFSISLFYEAHESSMKVVRSLDSDLKEFLEETLLRKSGDNYHQFPDYPPLTIIAADHGMHYGRYSFSQPGRLEHKMPVLIFIVPVWFTDLYPDIEDKLKANEQKLFSSFDLHYTLKHLMTYPRPPPKDSSFYSLISDIIPEERTCEEARIDEEFCLCNRQLNRIEEFNPNFDYQGDDD